MPYGETSNSTVRAEMNHLTEVQKGRKWNVLAIETAHRLYGEGEITQEERDVFIEVCERQLDNIIELEIIYIQNVAKIEIQDRKKQD